MLAATCIASLAIGTENVSLPTVWSAVTDYRDIGDQWIVHDLRIPRTVLALLVGLALGLSGTLIQAVGRNPLADSEVLGINSGAALFVGSAIALLGTTGIWTYIWFAFAGALFPAGGRGNGRCGPDRLRGPDGAARGAPVHRPGLALGARLRRACSPAGMGGPSRRDSPVAIGRVSLDQILQCGMSIPLFECLEGALR